MKKNKQITAQLRLKNKFARGIKKGASKYNTKQARLGNIKQNPGSENQ